MKEIIGQINNGKIYPYTEQDKDILKEFQENQKITVRIFANRKQRSLEQLRLFWVGCNKVAENTDDPHWNNKDKVAFQIKVATNYIEQNKTIVDNYGQVHFFYRSISFKELAHMEACNFFDQAFEIMAKKIDVSVDELKESFNDVE